MITLFTLAALAAFIGLAGALLSAFLSHRGQVRQARTDDAVVRAIAVRDRRIEREQLERQLLDTPVSEWVAEAEAQAERDFAQAHPRAVLKPDHRWVIVYKDGDDHRIPNKPDVIAHFTERGWHLEDHARLHDLLNRGKLIHLADDGVRIEPRDPDLPDPMRPPERR
jgi:hypothetical protein